MHHEHDLDLLDAFAEGRLDDPRPAESLIESCPECSDHYRDYAVVRAAVAAEPAPLLGDLERRRLRAAVWEEIGTETAPARSTPWWYRVAPVAAALAIVVGVAGVVGNDFVGSSDDGGAEIMADSAPDELDAPAAELAPSAADGEGLLMEAEDVLEQFVRSVEEEKAAARFEAAEIPEDFRCHEDLGLDRVEAAVIDGDSVWLVAYRGTPERFAVLSADTCEVLAERG